MRAIISSAFNGTTMSVHWWLGGRSLAAHVLRSLEMLVLLHLDLVDGCLESIPHSAGGQVIDHSGQA